MYSSATYTEAPRVLPLHDRRPSILNDHAHSYAFSTRDSLDLPRSSLAARPGHQLQSSLSESSASHRLQDPYVALSNPPSDPRPQGQSLPGIQDILTSEDTPSRQAGYGSNWTSSNNGPPAARPNSEGYYNHAGWHPPLVFPPPPPPDVAHPRQNGRIELPTLETTSAGRQPPVSVPMSPFTPYPDVPRSYSDLRHDSVRPPPGLPYTANGVTSPYGPTSAEDSHYRSHAGSLPAAYGQSIPETSRKYIGIREVPGEGMCHLYEGGFRIPTHVDGETVNPAWGLTKANKPRKRLAMACLDCREKKIKCEPGIASCLQCEKAKRPCRKAPAHQSQGEAAVAPGWQNSTTSPGRKGISVSDPNPAPTLNGELDPVGKRRSREDPSPSGIPTKKHRSASPQLASEANAVPLTSQAPLDLSMRPETPGKPLAWDEDPYAVAPALTPRLLELYFDNIHNTGFSLFPPRHFIHWLTTQQDKSLSERLVLYAMLAAGSIFADGNLRAFGKHCALTATELLQTRVGYMNLADMQARLLLGLYHTALGTRSCASDYIASTLNALVFLRYNTERGCEDAKETPGKTSNGFNLSQVQLFECRRRTFWCGFLAERHLCGPVYLISPKDIFLRLPCTDDVYERGTASEAPRFNNGIAAPVECILTGASEISPEAWLVLVAAIWGDANSSLSRNTHRPREGYVETYEMFYADTASALQGWSSRLPPNLLLTQANVRHSVQQGHSGPLIAMHVTYHLTMMKVNRYMKHGLVPELVARNVRAAHHHAHSILDVVGALESATSELAGRDTHFEGSAFTMPILGHAISAAIDVISAGGPESNFRSVREVIDRSVQCLHALSTYWNTARDAHKNCEKRYYQIQNMATHPHSARSGAWLSNRWGVEAPLEHQYSLEEDCIYGIRPEVYFDALQDGAEHEGSHPGALRLG